MTAQHHDDSSSTAATNTNARHNETTLNADLSQYKSTSSTDKNASRGTQIELVESPGASQQARQGTDNKDQERGKLGGWASWRRQKDKKMKVDDGGEPLEQVRSNEELLGDEDLAGHTIRRSRDGGIQGDDERGGITGDSGPIVWKVYKRRWFGLAQLVLLNVIVSWDVSSRFRYAILAR